MRKNFHGDDLMTGRPTNGVTLFLSLSSFFPLFCARHINTFISICPQYTIYAHAHTHTFSSMANFLTHSFGDLLFRRNQTIPSKKNRHNSYGVDCVLVIFNTHRMNGTIQSVFLNVCEESFCISRKRFHCVILDLAEFLSSCRQICIQIFCVSK